MLRGMGSHFSLLGSNIVIEHGAQWIAAGVLALDNSKLRLSVPVHQNLNAGYPRIGRE